MTNLHSILKSRDITLQTKVRLVKAIVFPVVMYGCEILHAPFKRGSLFPTALHSPNHKRCSFAKPDVQVIFQESFLGWGVQYEAQTSLRKSCTAPTCGLSNWRVLVVVILHICSFYPLNFCSFFMSLLLLSRFSCV